MRNSRGFTLIEMVIVILLIGILSAFALPRLFSFSSEANKADVVATQSSLRAALKSLQARWLTMNQPAIMTVQTNGGPVYLKMNTQGFPIGVNTDATSGIAVAGAPDNSPEAFALIANALTNSSIYVSLTNANAALATHGQAWVLQNYQYAITSLPTPAPSVAPAPGG